MASDIIRQINEGLDRLIPAAMNLRDCIENFGTKESNELSDKIGIKIKTLIANYIRRRYPYLMAVTGPQGTGKSHLVNHLLNIPKEARLPYSGSRCEKVPVIVSFFQEGDDSDNPVTKIELIDSSTLKTGNIQNPKIETKKEIVMYWQQSDMSYEQARDEVRNDDGILYIWRIPYQKNVSSFKIRNEEEIQTIPIDKNFAMLVLPGIEEGERWSEFAKQSLLTADAAIFVIDHTRYAQNEGHQLIKYINDNQFDKPIVAISKSDTLNDKDEFETTIQKEWGVEHICFVGLPKIGIEDIGTALVNVLKNGHKNTFNYSHFKNYLRSLRDDLNAAKKIIIENDEGNYKATLENLVEYVMEKFQKAREHQEEIILKKINTILEEHTTACKNDDKIDSIIKAMGGETGWKPSWIGIIGPNVENIRKAEKLFSNLWSEGSTSSDNEKLIEEKALANVDLIMENKNSIRYKIAKAIDDWLKNNLDELNISDNNIKVSQKDLTSFFESCIAVSFSNNPDKYSVNLQEIFSKAELIREATRNYFKGDLEQLKQFSKSFNKYINRDMMKSFKRSKQALFGSPAAKGIKGSVLATIISLPGGINTVNIFGIAISEIALISVAGLGAFYIAHLASLRKREIHIYEMIKENLDYVKECTIENIKENLRFYLDTIEYDFKKMLVSSLGIEDDVKRELNLAVAIKQNENKLEEVINTINRL